MSFVFNELTNHCHINIVASVPNYKVKNRLNFRIHSVEMKDGKIVRDPTFADSTYVFPIKNALVGKKIQFNFSFLRSEIENVKKFKIGFCDEMVRWLDSTILTFENTLFQDSIVSSKAEDLKVEVATKIDSIEISTQVDVEDLQIPAAVEVFITSDLEVLTSTENNLEASESSDLEISGEFLEQDSADLKISDDPMPSVEVVPDSLEMTEVSSTQVEKAVTTTNRKQRRNKRK